MATNFKRRVVPKTADYTISAGRDQAGTTFTNRGATGTVIFTLPTPGRGYLGTNYRFRCVVDFTLRVSGTTNGDLLTKNDNAANSVSLQTAGELLGGMIEAECIETADGTFKWNVTGASVGHTFTIAT